MEGQYIVTVCFAGREIPKSPYLVNIEGDLSRVTVAGPAVDGSLVTVGNMTSFHVDTTGYMTLTNVTLQMHYCIMEKLGENAAITDLVLEMAKPSIFEQISDAICIFRLTKNGIFGSEISWSVEVMAIEVKHCIDDDGSVYLCRCRYRLSRCDY